jgi:hypothetical protein
VSVRGYDHPVRLIGPTKGVPVKKLLVLVILIALGVAVAKKVRDA